MISDTNVSPVQEVNYLLRFTSGEALKLIDNYRKQKQRDPNWLLDSLCAELERRFGGAAAITRVLLERTRIALVLPPFDFQNGGRQIKIQHVIVDAVAPLSFL